MFDTIFGKRFMHRSDGLPMIMNHRMKSLNYKRKLSASRTLLNYQNLIATANSNYSGVPCYKQTV